MSFDRCGNKLAPNLTAGTWQSQVFRLQAQCPPCHSKVSAGTPGNEPWLHLGGQQVLPLWFSFICEEVALKQQPWVGKAFAVLLLGLWEGSPGTLVGNSLAWEKAENAHICHQFALSFDLYSCHIGPLIALPPALDSTTWDPLLHLFSPLKCACLSFHPISTLESRFSARPFDKAISARVGTNRLMRNLSQVTHSF